MAADTIKGGNGDKPAAPAGNQVTVRIAGQYIKDLSFENPNIRRLMENPGDKPELNVEVNVGATRLNGSLFESAINFKAQAKNAGGVIYDLEISYAGAFQIENMPETDLEPFLLINCPSLLFPFLRRLVSDITREGGFPPLLLDPIDFSQLFAQRQQATTQPPLVN
jgi:preprotein translocase subunit SecB